MSQLKLYYDLMSQPSRCLFIFLNHNKIPFERKPVRLGNGEHMTKEFKQINPLQLVPVIEHNGKIIRESVGILRYLCRFAKLPDHWYPADVEGQAKYDEFIEWQHLGLRLPCAFYFRVMWIEPLFTQKEPDQELSQKLYKQMVKACDQFENHWLSDSKFIFGDKISIADLLAATELEQPRMSGYDPRVGHPKLESWIERVRKETNPFYDEAHTMVNKIVQKFKGKSPPLASL